MAVKGAESAMLYIAPDRPGAGLSVCPGGPGPVPQLPHPGHRRPDHRRVLSPWAAAVSVTVCRRRATPSWPSPPPWPPGPAPGFVTAFLQTKLGVPSILAGIITNTGLYTVNLMAMGWTSNRQPAPAGHHLLPCSRIPASAGSWYEILLGGALTVVWRPCCWWLSWAPGWACPSGPPGTTGTWCGPPPSTPPSPSPWACASPTPSPPCPALWWASPSSSADVNIGTGMVVIGPGLPHHRGDRAGPGLHAPGGARRRCGQHPLPDHLCRGPAAPCHHRVP